LGGEDPHNEFQESMNEGSSVLIGEKSLEQVSQSSNLQMKEPQQVQIKKVILQGNQNLMKINKLNKSRMIIQQSQQQQVPPQGIPAINDKKNNIVIND
jgi:hypothetical protein